MSMTPKTALLTEFATVARALGNPHRLVLLELVAQGERGVEGLARKAGMSVANCSQHLQVLRRAGLVSARRAGKSVLYSLSGDAVLGLMDDLRTVAEDNLAKVERILQGLAGAAGPVAPVSREELSRLIQSGEVTVIDTRPADEYDLAHLPGAIHVPLSEIGGFATGQNREREIVAYCRGSYCLYAHEAAAMLRARGLKARVMAGGLPHWRADGRPVAGAGQAGNTSSGSSAI